MEVIVVYIRPVSDLRNKFPEIERIVREGEPVYLTKNGYGTMVVMSIDQYSEMSDDVEIKLDEADRAADMTDERFTANEVFGRLRRHIQRSKNDS